MPISEAGPQVWSQILLLRALVSLRDMPIDEQDPGFIRPGPAGEKQVLVSFRSRADGKVHTIWCRLGKLAAQDLIPSVLWFFLKLGLFAVGLLVFWKRPGDASAAQFFLLCLVTVGAYMGGYHWARIAIQPTLLVIFIVCGVLLPAVSLHFYLVFPRPKAVLHRHPYSSMLGIYGPALAFLVALIVCYMRVRWLVRGGADATDAWSLLRNLASVYLRLAGLWYLASVVSLVHSYRTAADPTERNQVKWILVGALTALVPIGYSLYLVAWQPADFGAGKATWPMFAASVCFTVAFAVSITRYRLMQLDQVVSVGVVYFVLAGLVYYAVVFAGMLAANLLGGQASAAPSLGQAFWVSTSVLVLMLLLDLARTRVKKALDRRFYREKYQLDRTLRRMGQAIEQLVDPPTLARRLLHASAELLGVPRGAVYLREGDPPLYRLVGSLGPEPPLTELSPGCPLVEVLRLRGTLVARAGAASAADPAQRQLRLLGGEVAYALAHEGHLLALLLLGPREPGPYGADDLNLLAAFAQLTALALESALGHRTIESLNHELQAKVEKISEQQRRILALQSQLMQGAMLRETRTEPPGPALAANGMPSAQPPAVDPSGIIVGSSPQIRHLLHLVRKVAVSDSPVLILGESGTGKGLLARTLHENSPRAGKPFVPVHCGALSAGVLESELFGHVKGAFTSADRQRVGRFELADGGTLFLDEIGDISLEVQTRLLRVLQEMTFERVGSSQPVKVDVWVLAATHRNLEELIREGRFRSDLYYRLNVISISVPPLRERREDVPELVLHFLRVYGPRCGKPDVQIDDDALSVLKSYDWPGNVRELESAVKRAVVMAEESVLTVHDLPSEVLAAVDDVPVSGAARAGGEGRDGMRVERAQRDQAERERLVRALAAADGNKAEAARALGLARSTLISRLKKLGLQ
jgi:transcriptional regulator with GAF, ATPase, and Fis domain